MANIRRGMMGAAGAAGGGGTGAVQLNGSTYFKKESDLTGNANSIYFTYSYWFRLDEANTSKYLYGGGASSGARVMVSFVTGWGVELRNASDQRMVDTAWSYNASDYENWHHACGNYDTGSTSNRKNYQDDSDVTAGQGGAYDGSAID